MKRLITLIFSFAFIFILIFAIGFMLRTEEKDKVKNNQNEDELKKVLKKPEVVTSKSRLAPLEDKIFASGTIHGGHESNLLSLSSGYVINVFKKNGDFVQGGDSILQLKNEDIELAYDKAVSHFFKMRSDYILRLRDDDKNQQLKTLEEDLFASVKSSKDLQRLYLEIKSANNTQLGLLQSKTGYSDALLSLLEAQIKRNQLTIRAEQNGFLAGLTVQRGQYVKTQEQLAVVTSRQSFIVRLALMIDDLKKIKMDQDVEWAENPEIIGKIISRNPLKDKESNLYLVDAKFPENPHFYSGEFIKVYIHIHRNSPQLLVKNEAIIFRDNKSLVFVVREGIAVWCYVTLGKSNNQYTEILDSKMNLKEEEPIVISGHYSLAHGAEVDILENIQ